MEGTGKFNEEKEMRRKKEKLKFQSEEQNRGK
jgi:hypothetical protein